MRARRVRFEASPPFFPAAFARGSPTVKPVLIPRLATSARVSSAGNNADTSSRARLTLTKVDNILADRPRDNWPIKTPKRRRLHRRFRLMRFHLRPRQRAAEFLRTRCTPTQPVLCYEIHGHASRDRLCATAARLDTVGELT